MGSGTSKTDKKEVTLKKIQAANAFSARVKQQNSSSIAESKKKFILPSKSSGQSSTGIPQKAPETVEGLWTIPRELRTKWKEMLAENILENHEAKALDDKLVQSILSGLTLPEKAKEKNVVRVFLSSTFTDTSSERNMLIADVYPYLKQYSRRYGFEFGVSEMRWGIREEASNDHLTSIICMAEIKRCQEESKGINYVIMLCDKYGYRPFPSQIEKREFVELLAQAKADAVSDAELLTFWFDLDANLVPAEYKLKPSTTVGKDEWWPICERLTNVLRKASKCLKDVEKAKRYTYSVTEEEVHRGLFYLKNREEVTYAYRRTIQDVHKHCAADPKVGRRIVDMQGSKVVDDSQKLLAKLKEKTLPSFLSKEKIRDYSIDTWGPGVTPKLHGEYLRDFGDHFCGLMADSIRAAIEEEHHVHSSLYEEVRAHAAFCHSKAGQVFGRDPIIKQIQAYIDGNSEAPLVVHGVSGSGKTSLMAKAIMSTKTSSKQKMVYRFLGTTEESISGRALLRSLCQQLASINGEQSEEDDTSDFRTLCKTFEDKLKVKSSSSIVIFLDSLDQLSNEDSAWKLEWLPKKLPSSVKIVVSTLPDIGDCLKVLQQSLPEKQFVEMTALSMTESRDVLESWLTGHSRSLNGDQMLYVLDMFKECALPIYLKIAFETSLNWSSFTPSEDTRLAGTVKGLINQMFDRLCRFHGDLLIQHALSYLTVARFGLSENEMEDILSCDDDVLNDVFQFWIPPVRRVPPLLWVRIRTELGPFMVERLQEGGAGILAWYHRQFAETATERFLPDEASKAKYLSVIADYFMESWVNQSLPYINKQGVSATADRKVSPQPLVLNEGVARSKRTYNRRKLTELPSALLKTQRLTKFAEKVCEIGFIEAKCAIGLVYELLAEVQQAAKMAEDLGKTELQKHFNQFVRYLRENVSALNKFPASALQQAANFPDDTYPSKAAKAYLEQNTDAPRWLSRVAKPQEMGAKIMTLTWDQWEQSDNVSFSPDGTKLASGVKKSTGVWYRFGVWDLTTGAQLYTITSKDNSFMSVKWSPTGEYIASGMSKSNVILMDPSTGMNVGVMGEYVKSGGAHIIEFSPDGKLLASYHNSKQLYKLHVYNVATRETLYVLVDGSLKKEGICHDSLPELVRFTADMSFLVTAEHEGLAKIWDAQDGYKLLKTSKSFGRYYFEDKEPEFQLKEGDGDPQQEAGGGDATTISVGDLHPSIPSGAFVGTYEMSGMKGEMSMNILFLRDGSLTGVGSDVSGSYTMTGSYKEDTKSVIIDQKYELYTSNYEAKLEWNKSGMNHLTGSFKMPFYGVAYKGEFDITKPAGKPDLQKLVDQQNRLFAKAQAGAKQAAGEADAAKHIFSPFTDTSSTNVTSMHGADVSPDSCLLATCNQDETINIYVLKPEGKNKLLDYVKKYYMKGKFDQGQQVWWLRYSEKGSDPKGLVFNRQDSNVLYCCGAHGNVDGFDILSRKKIVTYFHGHVMSGIGIHPKSELLVSIHDYPVATFMIWDLSRKDQEMAMKQEDTKAMELTHLDFSPCGRYLACTINNCNHFYILHTDTGKIYQKLKEGCTNESRAVFSPDGEEISVAHWTHVSMFNTHTGERLRKIQKVFGYQVSLVRYHPTEKKIALLGKEQEYIKNQNSEFEIRLIDPEGNKIKDVTKQTAMELKEMLVYSKDGTMFYGIRQTHKPVQYSHSAVALDSDTGTVKHCCPLPPKSCATAMDVDENNERMAVGTHGGPVFLVDIKNWQILLQTDYQGRAIDGEAIAYLQTNDEVSAAAVGRIKQHPGQPLYLAYGDKSSFVKIYQLH